MGVMEPLSRFGYAGTSARCCCRPAGATGQSAVRVHEPCQVSRVRREQPGGSRGVVLGPKEVQVLAHVHEGGLERSEKVLGHRRVVSLLPEPGNESGLPDRRSRRGTVASRRG